MEKNGHYFLVGIFVTSMLAALTGFVMWLASPNGDMRDYDRYTVYFSDSVSGLEEGASVQYRGVDIGKVMAMRVDPGRGDLVKVDIEVKKGTPVRAKTRVSLEMQGITGTAHLQLAGSSRDTEPPPRKEGEQYPVLEGSGSPWAKIEEDLPVITQQVREAATKINGLLNEKNISRLTGH